MGFACNPADLSAVAESPAKFEARPLSSRGVKVRSVAECPDQGPLTEPAADARPRGWGLIFLPHSSHPCSSGGSSALGFKAVIYSLPPIGGDGRVEDGRGSLGPMANAPFPIPAHRTGRAALPHPALRLASPRGTRRCLQWQAFEA